MVNAAGLLQIWLSCKRRRTAKLMFCPASTCQGTVVDLFTKEWEIIPTFKVNTFGLVLFQARGGSANSKVTQTYVFLLKKEPVNTWNLQIPAQRYQFTLCKHFLDIIHTEKTLCQSFVIGWLCITELLFSCYVTSVLDSKAHTTYFTVHAFSVMPTLAVAVSGETADLTQGAYKKQTHGSFVRAASYDL